MIRSLKMFAQCVESMRTAEKAYEANKTPANLRIVKDLQNKVDGWLSWVKSQPDAGLTNNVPPFIGKTRPQSAKGEISKDVYERLAASHTPEEMENFNRLMQGGV